MVQLVAVNAAFRSVLFPSWISCRSALHQFSADPVTALSLLQTSRRLPVDHVSIAHFLFCSHGQPWLEQKVVGNFITAPLLHDAGLPDFGLAHEGILRAYVAMFDFSSDTPSQALRRLLTRTRMPRRTAG